MQNKTAILVNRYKENQDGSINLFENVRCKYV